MDNLSEGNSLYVDENFSEALSEYHQAVESLPDSADARLKMCACLCRLERFADAADAGFHAIRLDPTLETAHYFLGLALLRQGKAHAAKKHLTKCVYLAGSRKPSRIAAARALIAECTSLIAAGRAAPEGMADAEHAEKSAQVKSVATLESALGRVPAPVAAAPAPAMVQATPVPAPTAPVVPAVPVPPAPLRHEWYQSETHVTVSLLLRGCDEAQTSVEVGTHSLSAQLVVPGATPSNVPFSVTLRGEVVPDGTETTFRPSKVEVKLRKAPHAQFHWPSLEVVATQQAAGAEALATASAPLSQPVIPSAYSSKKDWNSMNKKLAAEVDEDEKPGDSATGAEGLHHLFKNIYGTSTEDTQKAMNKSYQLSNGLVLSTNWAEVQTKEFEEKCRKTIEEEALKSKAPAPDTNS